MFDKRTEESVWREVGRDREMWEIVAEISRVEICSEKLA